MIHVTCDVIGIAQYHFLKSKMAAMYFALCQNLKLFLVNLHWKTLKTELSSFSDTTGVGLKFFPHWPTGPVLAEIWCPQTISLATDI